MWYNSKEFCLLHHNRLLYATIVTVYATAVFSKTLSNLVPPRRNGNQDELVCQIPFLSHTPLFFFCTISYSRTQAKLVALLWNGGPIFLAISEDKNAIYSKRKRKACRNAEFAVTSLQLSSCFKFEYTICAIFSNGPDLFCDSLTK